MDALRIGGEASLSLGVKWRLSPVPACLTSHAPLMIGFARVVAMLEELPTKIAAAIAPDILPLSVDMSEMSIKHLAAARKNYGDIVTSTNWLPFGGDEHLTEASATNGSPNEFPPARTALGASAMERNVLRRPSAAADSAQAAAAAIASAPASRALSRRQSIQTPHCHLTIWRESRRAYRTSLR